MSSDLKKIVVKDLLEVLDENRVGVMPIEDGYKMRVNVAEDGRDLTVAIVDEDGFQAGFVWGRNEPEAILSYWPRVKEEGFKQTFGVVLTYY